VGLKVLKNRLSEYVRLAASGERVLITDRDRVVAELVPPAERSPMLSDALFAEAVRRGHVTPAAVPPGIPLRRPTASPTDVLKGLDADREDR
jgi:antitoxin (DNA-binding transcriptional repressor) of toxin-antitoxin stability system